MGRSKDIATRVGIDDNADATAITIDSSENVGVGTTSPATPIAKFGGSAKGLAVKAGQPTVAVEASANSQYVGYLGQASTNTYLGALGGGSLIMQTGTSGTTRMTIDSSGIVTKPNHPSFSAYINTSNPTITSNPTKIPYNAVRWDIGNNFDETNHRYIAPVAGVYHFTANHNVYGLTDDQYFRTRIYVNASPYSILGYARARGGGDHTLNDSILINLSAADTVEVYTSSADTSYSLSAALGWNSFSGFLVG